MKILFLTDNFPPEVNAPATRTLEHCKEWVKSGHEVTVITCFPNYPTGIVYPGYKNSLYKVEQIEGMKVIRVWSYMAANKGFIKRIADFVSFSVTSFIAGLFQKCDIIVATSPQFFTALSGRTLHFFKHKPWVMEVRDLWPDSIKAVGAMKESPVLKYFSMEEKWCYKSAEKIVVVTNSFKREIIKMGIPAEKIYVVKNGANTELFRPQAKCEELLCKYKMEGKRVLGYADMHMYDIYPSLVPNAELKLSFEEAFELCLKGLEPLGEEYLSLFRKGRDEGWIDVCETEGKRSGAYSIGIYGNHPFVLLNYQKTTHDVFTIAHEMGHALHTYKSTSAQPYAKASYTIFLAEIASTVNEVLLLKHLYKKTEDKE